MWDESDNETCLISNFVAHLLNESKYEKLQWFQYIISSALISSRDKNTTHIQVSLILDLNQS